MLHSRATPYIAVGNINYFDEENMIFLSFIAHCTTLDSSFLF